MNEKTFMINIRYIMTINCLNLFFEWLYIFNVFTLNNVFSSIHYLKVMINLFYLIFNVVLLSHEFELFLSFKNVDIKIDFSFYFYLVLISNIVLCYIFGFIIFIIILEKHILFKKIDYSLLVDLIVFISVNLFILIKFLFLIIKYFKQLCC